MPDANAGASAPTEVPRYRVIAECFLEPIIFRDKDPLGNSIGAEIEWDGDFGTALEPLNAAAKAKAEEWYSTPFPAKDDKGRLIPNEFEYPRAKYRPIDIEASTAPRHRATVTAAAPRDDPGENPLSLAEVAARSDRTPTDQRPGPAVRKRVIQSPIEVK